MQRSAVFNTVSTHFFSLTPHPVRCSRWRGGGGRVPASAADSRSRLLDLVTGFWEMKSNTALKNGYQLPSYRFMFRQLDIPFAYWRHVVSSCKLIYLNIMSNKRQVANFFSFLRDWKCPARIDRKQPCENRTIFSNAIDALQLIPHAYADDTQIYGFCRPADSAELCEKVSVCVDEVSAWMASNRLQLNHAKTEVLWCTSSRRCRLMITRMI